MSKTPEIRIHAMFRHDPQSPGWAWAHILTFPVDVLNKMQYAHNPYMWIRYATGVVVGAQGVLSTERDSQDHMIHNDDLPSTSMDLYYHVNGDERNRMYPIDPLLERTMDTSSVAISGSSEFCRLVRARDGTCVLTGMRTVDAAHLVQHGKGDDYIAEYTRHRSRDPKGNDVVTEIDDVRNGILLNLTGCCNFGKDFAFLITPNFTMTSADIGPHQPETKVCTAHLFVPGMEELFGDRTIRSGSRVRMSTSDDLEWPPDILFDIVYGGAILHNFGTQTLRDASRGWQSHFYSDSVISPPDDIPEASQTSQRKRKRKRDHERAQRTAKRRERYAEGPDDHFDALMFMPYIFMQPERVMEFWREAEGKRQEQERSQLEDKVSDWAKGVTNANDDNGV